MDKYLNLPTFLLSSFLIRLLIVGASIGDSITMLALAGLYGVWYYFELKREPEANKDLKNRIVELEESQKLLRDKVNSSNLGSQLRR